MKEAAVLRDVKRTLDVLGILYIRNNSGAVQVRPGKFMSFGSPGSADIIACTRGGRFLAIECKAPKTGRMSELQRDWLDKVNTMGGIGIVVDSVKSLHEQLKEAEVV